MRLTKHHGLGNDFLVLLDSDGVRPIGPETVRALCDRHRGVGADGLLRVTRGTSMGGRPTDVTMHLFNADGGRAEMSGNGISCLAQAAVLSGLAHPPLVRVATDTGLRIVDIEPAPEPRTHLATVDMGVAEVGEDAPEWVEDEILRARHISMGNPHLVLHIADPDADIDLIALGEEINNVTPGGTNVELVTSGPLDDEITMRVFERGVGITEACGTGACAAAIAAQGWDLAGKRIRVHQPGGPADVEIGDTIRLTVPVTFVAMIDVPA